MMIEYIGLAEKVEGGYTVFFPDFPGFGSEGRTLEEARENAGKGLVTHMKLMIEDHLSVPKPTSLENIVKLSDAKGCIPLIISITPTVQKC